MGNLLRSVRENALIGLLSPLRNWPGRFRIGLILLMPFVVPVLLKLSGEAPPSSYRLFFTNLSAIYFMLVAVSFSYATTVRWRRASFVQDLWLTRLTGKEIAFAICFWPAAAMLLAIFSAAAASLLGSMLITGIGPWKQIVWEGFWYLLPVHQAPPAIILLTILLVHTLDLAQSGWEWYRRVCASIGVGVCGAMIIGLGCYIGTRAISELSAMGQPAVSNGPWDVASVSMHLAYFIIFCATMSALVQRAEIRVFASIETAEADRWLTRYLPGPVFNIRFPKRFIHWPGATRFLAVTTTTSVLYIALTLVSTGQISARIALGAHDTYLWSFMMAGVVLFTTAGILVRHAGRHPDSRLAVSRPIPRNNVGLADSVVMLHFPFFMERWLPLLALIAFVVISDPAWRARGSGQLMFDTFGVAVVTLLLQAWIALMLTPKKGRWLRLAMIVGTIIWVLAGFFVLTGIQSGAERPALGVVMFAALSIPLLFLHLGWTLLRGYRSTMDRLLVEASEQERLYGQ